MGVGGRESGVGGPCPKGPFPLMEKKLVGPPLQGGGLASPGCLGVGRKAKLSHLPHEASLPC